MEFTVKANLIDIISRETYPAEVSIVNNKIHSINRIEETPNTLILPGFIDAHVHIESSSSFLQSLPV